MQGFVLTIFGFVLLWQMGFLQPLLALFAASAVLYIVSKLIMMATGD